MPRNGVTFELERFAWVEGAPVLEVQGRWRAPRRRRLGPASLVVEAAGRRRLDPITSTGDARADPDPGLWRAEFPWAGVPAAIEGAELEVGSGLVIELPEPDGPLPYAPPRRGASVAPPDPVRAELESLRRQAEIDRAEAERLRELLGGQDRTHAETTRRAAEAAETALREERASAKRAAEAADKRQRDALAAARKEAEAADKRHQDELAAARREAEAVEKRHRDALAAARKEAEAAEKRHQDELAAAEKAARKAAEAAERRRRDELATAHKEAEAATRRHKEQLAAAERAAEVAERRHGEELEAVRRLHHEALTDLERRLTTQAAASETGGVGSAARELQLAEEREAARAEAERLRRELAALQLTVTRSTPPPAAPRPSAAPPGEAPGAVPAGRKEGGDATVEWGHDDLGGLDEGDEEPTLERTLEAPPFDDGEPTVAARAPRGGDAGRRSLFAATGSRAPMPPRPRTQVTAATVPRRYAERPPRDSTPLRLMALSLVGLLVVIALVIVVSLIA